MKYYIQDLGNGFGTFLKIQSETILKNDTLINIGESYLTCTLGIEEDTLMSENPSESHVKVHSSGVNDYSSMLNIKIFSGQTTKYDPM